MEGKQTQRVTAADLMDGRIRLPAPAKELFPAEKTQVQIVLRGRKVECLYDPRFGPDKERSARLSVGRDTLQELVAQDEILTVSRTSDMMIQID